ncbi:hypothetical protein N7466_000207 [Penicillium verhagenii]|uniref:uncharacterized protein n=1 Tax=Penicillium verhagenii TaxID=1562060 RepID=UPI002545B79E|nr:uncharacterized protein N7466_000207 [Penicillium verhagenii]KAJ5947192.1 hypothetical protein N7466_000207 [Penicillium verhagenii]
MLSPNPRSQSAGSPPAPSNGAKRKRKVYSCHPCRRRKLRCDRSYPTCSRCQTAGQSNSCSYDGPPPSKSVASIAAPVAPIVPPPLRTPVPVARANYDDHRQAALGENPLSDLEVGQNVGTWQLLSERAASTADVQIQRPAVKADNEEPAFPGRTHDSIRNVIFRGENFRTQYYGGSNPASLIGHFPELRSFMKEAIKNQKSLYRVQHDLKSRHKKWKVEKVNTLSTPQLDFTYLLPDQRTINELVHRYFDNYESIYRIIHGPSFWEEYAKFSTDHLSTSSAFVVLVLLIMATASCISPNEQTRYIGDSSLGRERAVMWIEASESWLRSHSQKNVYLAVWQIRCLLLLAKLANTVKKKRHWTEAGNLVREAMAAGMHRDPGLLGDKISAFDREMRRRLWATMTELELQASIDRGMTSTSAGAFADTKGVLNLEDKDLLDEPDALDTQRPATEYTASSFLYFSNMSFSLRVSLNSVVNDMNSPLRYEEVMHYEDLITKELQKLPPWSCVRSHENENGLSLAARTLLDVQLRQFLIMLHAPFARQAEASSRHSFSRMVCFDAASSIIDQYTRLIESHSLVLLLQRHDYFRAALVMCQNSYISMNLQSELIPGHCILLEVYI